MQHSSHLLCLCYTSFCSKVKVLYCIIENCYSTVDYKMSYRDKGRKAELCRLKKQKRIYRKRSGRPHHCAEGIQRHGGRSRASTGCAARRDRQNAVSFAGRKARAYRDRGHGQAGQPLRLPLWLALKLRQTPGALRSWGAPLLEGRHKL